MADPLAAQECVHQPLGQNRPAGMVHDHGFPEGPSQSRAVLEEAVHPRIGVRVVGMSGAVHRVTTGGAAHHHHAHSVGVTSVHRPEVPVVKGFLPQNQIQGFDQVRLGGTKSFDPGQTVFFVFSTLAQDQMPDRRGPPFEALCVLGFQLCNLGSSFADQRLGLALQPFSFLVIQRPHHRFGDRGNRAQNRFLPTTGASAIPRDQGIVVGADHQVVL